MAFAKLYTTKTPITAADMLNDKVLPFFETHALPMLRILTNRGTEYCGRVELHDYHRIHQGKMCCGRTPIGVLEDGKSIWAEKNLAQI